MLLPGICSKRLRKFSRYQRGHQKPYIEEGETTQWPKGKRTTYKYDLHNTTQKIKFILLSNLNPTKILAKLNRSVRVSSSCSTVFTRRVTDSYKPITNTAWVRARFCKLQERVHSTRSRK
jgi:hypothetical protein